MSELALKAELEIRVETGELSRLAAAFAHFVADLAQPTPEIPALMLASAVLAHLEGMGHGCLDLATFTDAEMPGLGAEAWHALREAASPLPRSIDAWRASLASCSVVWRVDEPDGQQPLVLDGDRLYLRRYWRDETRIAASLRHRLAHTLALDPAAVRVWLDRLFSSQQEGPDWQKFACALASRGYFSVITGGPGTGKTYTVARLLALLFALSPEPERLRVALAAPTGKAAARLKASIDEAWAQLSPLLAECPALAGWGERLGAACTLHSLLGTQRGTRAFRHNAGNPLEVDVLIVDEASMVHLGMMADLLEALPDGARLILLGDKDQLASVEAGAVLGELCRDAEFGRYCAQSAEFARKACAIEIPDQYLGDGDALAQQTVMLRRSRRFSGPIGQLAVAVNAGDVAAVRSLLVSSDNGALDWLHAPEPSALIALACEGYRPYLDLVRSGAVGAHESWVREVLRAFDRFRVLAAVREGEWGVAGLNQAVVQKLERSGILKRSGEWYSGRPVMITRNDYGAGVFNGDIGIALPDPVRGLRVYFADGELLRAVSPARLRDVETAFAMTVHKSQGSEFAHTVLALPGHDSAVLSRELIYTGITRARERFTLVCAVANVLDAAVRRATRRASGLNAHLREAEA